MARRPSRSSRWCRRRCSTAPTPAPVDTSGALSGLTITQVVTLGSATCALSSAGRAYCWGDDSDGTLGNGAGGSSNVPVAVDTSGVLTVYEGSTDRFVPWYGEYAAFGSGCDVAYGALEMGATAEQAVAAAIRRNTNSGGTIQVETPGLPEQDTE